MHLTLRSYITGFALSLTLTLVPFVLVLYHILGRGALFAGIVASALLQLVIQLGFFLHVSLDASGRPRLFSFLFTAVMVLIVVLGSLWIMHDLNYFMMDPVMAQMPHGHGGD